MRYSISTLLITLLFSVAILPAAAHAQTTAPPVSLNPSLGNQLSANPLVPFNLISLAYQGYLKDQGIPSYGALLNAIESGKITAQDMVQAAVQTNRLSEQMLSDRGYRYHLEAELRQLAED
jgi:hypothetical protein